MTDLIPFDFEGKTVRVIERDGEPWFMAADVCRILQIANPSRAVSSLEECERQTVTVDTLHDMKGVAPCALFENGAQAANLISESGLYALVFKSQKPAAKRFRLFVTGTILPTIRKTGGYGSVPIPAGLPDFTDPIVAARAWADEKEGRQIAETKLAEQAPMVAGYERIARAADSSLNITQAAKVVKIKRPDLIDWMIQHHWLYRVQSNGKLTAHSYGLHLGYLEVRYSEVEQQNGTVRAFAQPLVTAKGVARLAAVMVGA